MGASAGTSPGPISFSQPSHIYRPTYQGEGLGATPQASMYRPSFSPQMPTYSRAPMMQAPSRQFGLFPTQGQSYSIPYRPSMAAPQRADPNLTAINRAFAPQRPIYDGEGGSYMPTRYMDPSQRNAILQNPGNYLNYARYIQEGNDPSAYRAALQRPQMMSQAQRNSLMASQRAELSGMLPPATPSDSGG